MRMWVFAKRNTKEIVLDPLSVIFGIGFPVVILLLLHIIDQSIPKDVPMDLYSIENITPGIASFGLSFITLFSALLVAKDKSSSLLARLFTTPLRASDYILGYTLPLIPIALIQTVICYAVALVLGLEFSVNIIRAVLSSVPIAVFYIALGLLFGTILNEKQVGGLCGALVTNLSAWLSGAWFDITAISGLSTVAKIFPFLHCVEFQKAVLAGNTEAILPHFWIVLAYTAVLSVAAVVMFMLRMREK